VALTAASSLPRRQTRREPFLLAVGLALLAAAAAFAP